MHNKTPHLNEFNVQGIKTRLYCMNKISLELVERPVT
jgi:hypothetical protein